MGTRGRRRVPLPGLWLGRRVGCLRQAPEKDRNKGVEGGQKVRFHCPWVVKVRSRVRAVSLCPVALRVTCECR